MASDHENDQPSEATQEPKRGHEQGDEAPAETKPCSRSHSEAPSNPSPSHSLSEDASLPIDELPPPLPTGESPPPLPSEALPEGEPQDDGWEPIWDDTTQSYYFHNRKTGVTQWENPRIASTTAESKPRKRPHGGYDPAIHGDYDPTASYAVETKEQETAATQAIFTNEAPTNDLDYSAAGHFNRFTGKWQSESQRAENYSDEAKSKRQMNAFFDVDAAANSHSGKSLKAERANKKLSKQELKAFKEKRKEKKEEKRRAWLRD